MKKHPVVDALQKAAKGLLFPSESEAKLQPFLWQEAGDKLTESRLRELSGAEQDAPVEEESLEGFFRVVPEEDRAQFDKLAKALQEQLSGIKVYKVGEEAEKAVFIVGKTVDGHWAGLKTTVVET
jgi:hypothetical protein